MAHPIEATETLEGKDAKRFLADVSRPKTDKGREKIIKKSESIYREHKF
jgi:hypothetical protein